LGDYAKPYFLQQQRDQSTRMSSLEKQIKELLEKSKKSDESEDQSNGLMGSGLGGRLMIGGPA
jgi:clathrin heavy chain